MLNRPRLRHRRSKAFTLVELLVVVGIIAVLVSLLLPSLARAREQSRRIKCLSNMRQIGMAFMSYNNENKLHFPGPADGVHYDDWIYWKGNLPSGVPRDLNDSPIGRYMGDQFNEAVFQCPSDDIMNRNTSPVYKFSYSVNEQIFQPRRTTPTDRYDAPIFISPGAPYYQPQVLIWTMIVHPSDKILMIDEASFSLDDGDWSPWDSIKVSTTAKNLLSNRHDRNADEKLAIADPNGRAVGRGNCLFADWHADYVERKIVMDPKYFDPWAR